MIHNSDNIANRTGRTGDSPHCENRAEAGRSSKLYSVDLATNATLDVTFNYGGDQKRRSMTAGGVTTGYNWDAGWNVINEENGSGTLARTYFHHPQLLTRATLAHVNGANPATSTTKARLCSSATKKYGTNTMEGQIEAWRVSGSLNVDWPLHSLPLHQARAAMAFVSNLGFTTGIAIASANACPMGQEIIVCAGACSVCTIMGGM
jgi:hypothetical protein